MNSSELDHARRLFEQAERDTDPEHKLAALEEALDVIDDFNAENTAASAEVAYANNLRQAHIKQLLSQLVELRNIEKATWFSYIKLLLLRVESLVEQITAADPALHEAHRAFVAIWRDELLTALKSPK